jgi:RsiW-degrading membrane proteinase PrsW (M82 family)
MTAGKELRLASAKERLYGNPYPVKTPEPMTLTFYQTIFLSFLIGLFLIRITVKFHGSGKNWQHPLFILAGFAMIGVILWLLLQILIGLPSLAQTIDLPGIFLGLLIAYGFQNAVTAIQARAKNKFK